MSIKSIILRYTYWINDWFHGAPIRRQYLDIKKIQENHFEGEKLRKQHLHDLLSHAVKNSVYYKDCNPDDLSSFPIVNKNILRDNYERIQVPVNRIPYQKGNIHVQHTSGSTGTPFHIHQDTNLLLFV